MADFFPSDASLANISQDPKWSKVNFKQVEHLTPTKNVLERLRQCPSDKTPIILITTGSYCPIHKMHVEMHEIARRYIDDNFSAKVVGSLLSASHDSYLKAKLERKGEGKFWLDVHTRIKLINLAINDNEWIEQDLYEPMSPIFISFEEIMRLRKSFFRWLCSEHKLREPTLVMLVGEDMLPYNLYPRFPKENLGLAVIRRKNSSYKSYWPKLSLEKQMEEKVFMVDFASDIEISSSLVRRAGARKDCDTLRTLLHPDVVTEICSLWGSLGRTK